MGFSWLEILERSYDKHCSFIGECSRLDFLTENIFNITTYDDSISEIIGVKIIEVAEAITKRQTFEYIKDEGNYLWYITCVNFPFFYPRLNWGSSIRGAWWDDIHKNPLNTCSLIDSDGEQVLEWDFTAEEWCDFILSFRLFVEEGDDNQMP